MSFTKSPSDIPEDPPSPDIGQALKEAIENRSTLSEQIEKEGRVQSAFNQKIQDAINQDIEAVMKISGIEETAANDKVQNPKEFERTLKTVLDKISQPNSHFGETIRSSGVLSYFETAGVDFFSELKSIGSQSIDSISSNGSFESGLKAGGVSFVVMGLFGLGGENSRMFKELFNKSAWITSFSKRWKIASAGLITSEVATNGGLSKLLGLGLRSSLSLSGGIAYQGTKFLDNPKKAFGEIFGVSEEEEISLNLEGDIKKSLEGFKEGTPEYSILKKIIENPLDFEISESEMEAMAQNIVLGSEKLLTEADAKRMTEGTGPKSEDMVRYYFTVHSKYVGMALLNSSKYRKQFIEKVDEKLLQNYKKGFESYSIEDLRKKMNSTQLKKIDRVMADQNLSALGKFTSMGFSGMGMMAFLFLKMTIPLAQLAWSSGRQFLFSDKPQMTTKEKAEAKLNTAQELISTLFEKYKPSSGGTPKNLKKKDWKNFSKSLGVLGVLSPNILTKATSTVLWGDEKKRDALFHKLRGDDKFLSELKNTQSLEGRHKAESTIKEKMIEVDEKGGESISVVGALEGSNERKKLKSKKGKALADLITLSYALQNWKGKNFNQKNAERTWLNILKPMVFVSDQVRKVVASSKISKTPKSFRMVFNPLFQQLGVPQSMIRESNFTSKANLGHVGALQELSQKTIGFYEKENGEIVKLLKEKAEKKFPLGNLSTS